MIKSMVAKKQTRRITYRLYSNQAQSELLEKTVGCCRFVWNYFLDFSICYYEGTGDHLNYNYWSKILTEMKKDEEYSFLNDVSSICLQQTLKDLELAYENFFRRIKKGEKPGFPKFKRKFGKRSGCRFVGTVIIREKKYLQIPKVGLVKLKGDLSQLKNISSYTIYESCGEWYVSFVQEFIPKKLKKTKTSISLDKGVKRLYTRSDGEYKEAFRAKKEQERLKKLQKRISRKKIKSGKWAKTKLRISRINRKIARKRKDYLDKASIFLVREFDTIYVEDLKVKNMTGSAKGTIEDPGTNVSAKSGLNREILNQAWGMFDQMLEYKCGWYGKTLIRVNPKYTSQRCSNLKCGYIDPENRISQSEFLCKKCGLKLNADKNAAINIQWVGTTRNALGGCSLERL